MNWKQQLIGVVLGGIGLAAAGCDRNESVTAYDAPKPPAKQELPAGHPPTNKELPPGHPPMNQELPAGHPPLGGGQMPGMQAPAPEGQPVQWDVPAGWKQLPGSGMRLATLQLSEEDPNLVLTVIPLAGQSGSLAANVQRWEGQLGLPPTPDDQIGKVVQRVEANGIKIDTVDLTGPEKEGGRQRILGAIVPQDGRVWFFKAAGPADKMAKQKEKFDQFVRSIRLTAATATPATQPAR